MCEPITSQQRSYSFWRNGESLHAKAIGTESPETLDSSQIKGRQARFQRKLRGGETEHAGSLSGEVQSATQEDKDRENS